MGFGHLFPIKSEGAFIRINNVLQSELFFAPNVLYMPLLRYNQCQTNSVVSGLKFH